MLLQQARRILGALLLIVGLAGSVDGVMEQQREKHAPARLARKRSQLVHAIHDMAPRVVDPPRRLIAFARRREKRPLATLRPFRRQRRDPASDVVQMILSSLISRGFLRPSHHYIPCSKEEHLVDVPWGKVQLWREYNEAASRYSARARLIFLRFLGSRGRAEMATLD